MKLPLGELCYTLKNTVNPKNFPNQEFVHFSIPSFDDGRSPVVEKGVEIQSSKLCLSSPCLLFSRLNPRIKRVWDLSNYNMGSHCIGSTEWVPFVVRDSNQMCARYLFWFLQTDQFIRIARGNVRSATKSRERVQKERLFKIEIPLPPLDEQKRIAAILDMADSLRVKRRAALAKLDALVQSVFLEMFGDPVTNPMGWEVRKLKTCFSKVREGTKCGPFGSALKKNEYVDYGIPVWVMDNIQDSNFVSSGCLYITEPKYEQLKAYSVSSADIIISRAGTVGKMCVVNTDAEHSIISSNLIRLSLDPETLDPYYFVSLMTYCKGRVGRLQTGGDGAYSFMNTGVLQKLDVPVPSLESQLRYRLFLAQIDNEKLKSEKAILYADNLFHSLQQRAFRGEL